MTKDYLTSPFNDDSFKRNFDLMRKAVNSIPINKMNTTALKTMESVTKTIDYTKLTSNSESLVNKANLEALKGIGTIVKSANFRFDNNYMSTIFKSYQSTPRFNQMFKSIKSLEQVSQNINIFTNSTNFSHLFIDIPIVSSDALFNQSPLGAWKESQDDSISEPPNNVEEKTSDEVNSDKIIKESCNLLEQATDYGKKFSHSFFAPIKDPEELGKLVFEVMLSSLISIFFSIAITYGIPAAQYTVVNLWLEIQRRISQTK